MTNLGRGGSAMAGMLSVRFFAIDFPNGPVVTTGPVHQTLPRADARPEESVTFLFLQAQGRRTFPAEHGGDNALVRQERGVHANRVSAAQQT
jgi:hypothetical protein